MGIRAFNKLVSALLIVFLTPQLAFAIACSTDGAIFSMGDTLPERKADAEKKAKDAMTSELAFVGKMNRRICRPASGNYVPDIVVEWQVKRWIVGDGPKTIYIRDSRGWNYPGRVCVERVSKRDAHERRFFVHAGVEEGRETLRLDNGKLVKIRGDYYGCRSPIEVSFFSKKKMEEEYWIPRKGESDAKEDYYAWMSYRKEIERQLKARGRHW